MIQTNRCASSSTADVVGDEPIQAADTLLLRVPSQLGVNYNAHVLENIQTHAAPNPAVPEPATAPHRGRRGRCSLSR
ncbi:hypothetical protein GCM10009735_13470 [Actinomadura chokoriensis]